MVLGDELVVEVVERGEVHFLQLVGQFDPLGMLNQVEKVDLLPVEDELALHSVAPVRTLLFLIQLFGHLVEQSDFHLGLLLVKSALDAFSRLAGQFWR